MFQGSENISIASQENNQSNTRECQIMVFVLVIGEFPDHAIYHEQNVERYAHKT